MQGNGEACLCGRGMQEVEIKREDELNCRHVELEASNV